MPTTKTKSSTIIALLTRGTGATLSEISKATQWQTHSIRAFLAGLRKKGFTIGREQRGDDETAYRITKTPDQNAEQAAS
jgi:DNA-binding IclR family transcriptional regulator